MSRPAKNAAYYRARAIEVRAIADCMTSGPAREVLQSIAADYEYMADMQEDLERSQAWLAEVPTSKTPN